MFLDRISIAFKRKILEFIHIKKYKDLYIKLQLERMHINDFCECI